MMTYVKTAVFRRFRLAWMIGRLFLMASVCFAPAAAHAWAGLPGDISGRVLSTPCVSSDKPGVVTEQHLMDLEGKLAALFQAQVDALFSGGLDESADKASQAEFDRLVTELGHALYRYYVEQGQGTLEEARQRMRQVLENISYSGIGLAESAIDWGVAQVVTVARPVDTPEPTPIPQDVGPRLQTFGRTPDGAVSGAYRDPVRAGPAVAFTVTADGVASFRAQGAPADEAVVARYTNEDQATIEWKGVALDGYGPLTGAERAALTDLSSNALADALALIPLDMGCRGEAEVEPLQLAALLLPWQMRLKYLSPDRVEEAGDYAARSACRYFASNGGQNPDDSPGGDGGLSSQILLERAAPVPVVIGYFPFDAEGALEAVSSLGAGSSCRTPTAFARTSPPRPLFTSNLDMSARRGPGLLTLVKDAGRVRVAQLAPQQTKLAKVDEFGPCGAMCRGACGIDCAPNNCRQTEEWRCAQSEAGVNLGNGDMVRTTVYDCGVHAGCIWHDNCYDKCNSRWGCGTFLAAHCRHITPAGLAWGGDLVGASCDGHAIATYGRIQALTWARGGGPYDDRQIFEYNDPFPMARDLKACPPTLMVEWRETGDHPFEVYFVARTIQPVDFPTTFQFRWTFPDPVGTVSAGIGQQSEVVNNIFPGPGTYNVLLSLFTLDGDWVKDEMVEVTVRGPQDAPPTGDCEGARFHIVQVRDDGVKSREYDCILLPKSAWLSQVEAAKGGPLTDEEVIELENYYARNIFSLTNMEALTKTLPKDCLDAVMQDRLWVIFDGRYIDYAGDGSIAYEAEFSRGTIVWQEKKEEKGPAQGSNPFANL